MNALSSSLPIADRKISLMWKAHHNSLLLKGMRLYVETSAARHPVIQSAIASIRAAIEMDGSVLSVEQCSPSEFKLHQSEQSTKLMQDSEVIEMARSIINTGCSRGSSDIHLMSREHELRVAYRINGDLDHEESLSLPRQMGARLLSSLYTSMTEVADAMWRPTDAQDANIAKKFLPADLYSARIGTKPCPDGPLMVIRLQYRLPCVSGGLSSLQLEGNQLATLETLTRLVDGLVIFVGATGSGKTTSLQKVLSYMYERAEGRQHILTIEDPVEIPIAGANQTTISNTDGDERPAAFADAVRSSLRMDPDIIMVGEMRDEATADATFRAAITGHLVFTTLHAKSTTHLGVRLLDLNVSEIKLRDPGLISGVIFQKLIKRLCTHCKVPMAKGDWDEGPKWISKMGSSLLGGHIHLRGPGCSHCRNGIKGRVPVMEVIRTDKTFLKLAIENLREESVAYIRSQGTLTVHDHALLRIMRGEIDPRDAEQELGDLALEMPVRSAVKIVSIEALEMAAGE